MAGSGCPLAPLTLCPSRFCHQLDFSTSGVLCVALSKAAAASAYKCFKERRVTKAYLALVRPGHGDRCPSSSSKGSPQWQPMSCPHSCPQVRGHIQETRVTISYAIGRSSVEGRTHTMCIEGSPGTGQPVGPGLQVGGWC